MNAERRVAQLTIYWLFYAVAAPLVGWVSAGLGVLNLVGSVIGMAIGVGVTLAIGVALNKRIQFVRYVVIGLSGLSILLSCGGLVTMLFAFFSPNVPFSFGDFVYFVSASIGVALTWHSLRVLLSKPVSRLFARKPE